MQTIKITRSVLLAAGLFLAFIICWEGYLQTQGFTPVYNDDKFLWAHKRAEAYKSQEEATVFIGSSRIKFDLDIPEWRQLTGEDAIQLSLVGTSPVLLLKDLAADTSFKGKLVIDVTEVLFFSQNPFVHKSSSEATAYFKKQTPAEKFSAHLGFALESKLALLEEGKFSLTELLNDLELPNRPGVFVLPVFPKGFQFTTFDRQTYMADFFLKDTADLNKQTGIWNMLILGDPTPVISDEELQKLFTSVRNDINKIRSRGGKVIFIRTPSSSPMIEAEDEKYPREKYWNALLTATNTRGIHFKDYNETAGMICPEWSHLTPQDAIKYTRHLVQQLNEKNWFSNKVLAHQN